MVLIPKITCVVCPHSEEYIMVSTCFNKNNRCPYFNADVGKQLDCGYDVEDKMKPEPCEITDESLKSRW